MISSEAEDRQLIDGHPLSAGTKCCAQFVNCDYIWLLKKPSVQTCTRFGLQVLSPKEFAFGAFDSEASCTAVQRIGQRMF